MQKIDRARERLRTQGWLKIKILTGSMAPVISAGQFVLLEPLSELPNLFDIIVFIDQELLICHYVAHINRHFGRHFGDQIIITRNLADGEDLPFKSEQILGRVTSHRLSRLKIWKLRIRQIYSRQGQ